MTSLRLPVKAKRMIQNPSKQWLEASLRPHQQAEKKPAATVEEMDKIPLFYVEGPTSTRKGLRLTRKEATQLQRELHHWLLQEELVQFDRQLGEGELAYHCRLYLPSSALPLALTWATQLPLPEEWREEPAFITIFLPPFHPRFILVDRLAGVTYITGSAESIEIGKSFMRQLLINLKEEKDTLPFPL